MAQEKKVSTVADIGTVKIADDVVAMIAAFAALDVEGVASLPGDVTREMISKGGMKKIAKSVRVDVTRDGVKAELSIIVEYGRHLHSGLIRCYKGSSGKKTGSVSTNESIESGIPSIRKYPANINQIYFQHMRI